MSRRSANTDPYRDSLLTNDLADMLDHATSRMAPDVELGIDAAKKLRGAGFNRPWPPLIKMDAAVKMGKLFNP